MLKNELIDRLSADGSILTFEHGDRVSKEDLLLVESDRDFEGLNQISFPGPDMVHGPLPDLLFGDSDFESFRQNIMLSPRRASNQLSPDGKILDLSDSTVDGLACLGWLTDRERERLEKVDLRQTNLDNDSTSVDDLLIPLEINLPNLKAVILSSGELSL